MMSANEAGTKPSPSYIASSKVPSSKVSAAVNGETDGTKLPEVDGDGQSTASSIADGPSAVVEDQLCDQDVTKEDC